jgi:hypothetical protein
LAFSYWFDSILVSQLREDLLLCSSYFPLGVPNGLYLQDIKQFSGAVAGDQRRIISLVNWVPSTSFLAPLPGRKKTSARGVSHTQSFTLFIVLLYFIFACIFLSKIQKKIVSFIVATFTCFLLVLLEWVLLKTPSCVTLLAPKTMILSALLLRHLLLRQIFIGPSIFVPSGP